jgi:hypothetical protein
MIDLRDSKTDPEGTGRKISIRFATDLKSCPVRALKAWLDAAEITEDPVFRCADRNGYPSRRDLHNDSIEEILERTSARAGMNADPIGGTRFTPVA